MKKRLIVVGVFVIIFTVVTLIFIISYGVSDDYSIDEYLTSNGYKLVDEDTSQYIKETDSIDNFYHYQENNQDSKYLAYYFSIPLKTFKEYKMNYTSETDTTLIYTLTNKLNTNIIDFNYEISNSDEVYTLKGTYDIDTKILDCNMINNDLINKDTYCNNVQNKINNFIPKRNKLLENEHIVKAVNTTQNEVKLKD